MREPFDFPGMQTIGKKFLVVCFYIIVIAAICAEFLSDRIPGVFIWGPLDVFLAALVAGYAFGRLPAEPRKPTNIVIFFGLALFFSIYCWRGLAFWGLTITSLLVTLFYVEVVLICGLATGCIRPFRRK